MKVPGLKPLLAIPLAWTAIGCGGHSGYVVPPDQAFAGTLTILGGNGQSASVGSIYAQPMTVQYLDDTGTPRAGAVVVFTGPTTGAGITFGAGGPTSFEAATDTNGVAVSPAFQAANQTGSVNVTVAMQIRPVKSSPVFHLTNQ
jgi:hypothetical protein